MRSLEFLGILSGNDAANRLNRYQDKAKLTSMGKYKIGTDFWISHGIGRDLEFSLRKTQGRGEVENVEINLMMKKYGRGFCSGTCSGLDMCTVFSGGAGSRSDFR